MKKTVNQEVNEVPLLEAEEGTFVGLWRRCPDGYVWRSDLKPISGKSAGGPWLIAVSDRRTDYALLRRTSALSDFVKLAKEGTQEAITKFAEQYGQLDLGQPVTAADGRMQWADPLGGWLHGINTLRHLWETWSAVEVLEHEQSYGQSAVGRMEQLLLDRVSLAEDAILYHAVVTRLPFDTDLFGASLGPCTLCGEEQDAVEHVWRRVPRPDTNRPGRPRHDRIARGEAITFARVALAHLISRHLRGRIHLTLLDDGEGAMVRHVPDSLLATLYLQLALRIAGTGLSERVCEHCREPFFPKRRDQRFCSKKCRELAGYHRRRNAALAGQQVPT